MSPLRCPSCAWVAPERLVAAHSGRCFQCGGVMWPVGETLPQRASAEVMPWLIVRQRDDAPAEYWTFPDEAAARAFYDGVQMQWTQVWLCRVVQQGLTAPLPEGR